MIDLRRIREPRFVLDALGPELRDENQLIRVAPAVVVQGAKQVVLDGKLLHWMTEDDAVAAFASAVRTPDGTRLGPALYGVRQLRRELQSRRSVVPPGVPLSSAFWTVFLQAAKSWSPSGTDRVGLEDYEKSGELARVRRAADELERQAPSAWYEALLSAPILVFELVGSQAMFLPPARAHNCLLAHPLQRSNRRFEFLFSGQLPESVLSGSLRPVPEKKKKLHPRSLAAKDAPFIAEGVALIGSGKATGPHDAARLLYDRYGKKISTHSGGEESIRKRLERGIRKALKLREERDRSHRLPSNPMTA